MLNIKKIIGWVILVLFIAGILAGLVLVCIAKGASLMQALAVVGIAVLFVAVVLVVTRIAIELIYS